MIGQCTKIREFVSPLLYFFLSQCGIVTITLHCCLWVVETDYKKVLLRTELQRAEFVVELKESLRRLPSKQLGKRRSNNGCKCSYSCEKITSLLSRNLQYMRTWEEKEKLAFSFLVPFGMLVCHWLHFFRAMFLKKWSKLFALPRGAIRGNF